ncbi:hypothetical protein P4H94_03785 [Paenibacillus macerans]|uniref:Uncharacterized protein n=1 Tax=Paenibacillus macerans TaxID=44252 RepID=A0A6N8ETP8_PAEMA|nr:hypothetical protein [Paenibacillus macerans]MBS5909844.1 hypothetical protein [Paenibacillus macerans]MEC0136021.1 hypothetical protein [Paenibacillus macerans]MUG21781.1 hypothetical protein [Paenibacillus macerans]UMV46400.1 hypothetical protein LMZ02_23400 [Paenibacillus macerans]GIP07860.1 hypothetical protein J1TS5_00300 [Paenibacillus macerans]
MAGKTRYYLLLGFIGFLITFAVSAGNNLFMTSFIRGLIAFVVWFVLAFASSWMFGFLKELPGNGTVEPQEALLSEQGKGGNLDLTTPDESEQLNELLKPPSNSPGEAADFTPLSPPKLVKTPDDKDPEELAKVVRHLTEK